MVAVLYGFDVVAVRARVRYGIADKIALRNVNDVLRVVTDDSVVRNRVAFAAARADFVLAEIIIAKPFVAFMLKRVARDKLCEYFRRHTAAENVFVNNHSSISFLLIILPLRFCISLSTA